MPTSDGTSTSGRASDPVDASALQLVAAVPPHETAGAGARARRTTWRIDRASARRMEVPQSTWRAVLNPARSRAFEVPGWAMTDRQDGAPALSSRLASGEAGALSSIRV